MNKNISTIRKQSIVLIAIIVLITSLLGYVLLSSPFISKSVLKKNAGINNTFDNTIKSVIEHADPIYFPKILQPNEKNPATTVPILMYHDVVAERPAEYDGNKLFVDDFKAQMKYLVDNEYRTLTLDEFDRFYRGEIIIPKKSVMITFDDGFNSIRDTIEPILIEYNLHAISFIIGEKSVNESMYFLDSPSIQNLKQRNFVEFQSHSYGMHNWTDKSRGFVETMSVEEIANDKRMLEEFVQNEVTFFCYPFGHSGGTAEQNLLANGYTYAVTIEGGIASRKTNPMQLPRVRINANTTVEEFANKLIV